MINSTCKLEFRYDNYIIPILSLKSVFVMFYGYRLGQ